MSKEIPTIAKNIKKYRDKMGVFQDKSSKLANITLHTITNIESGPTPNQRIETVKKLQTLQVLVLMTYLSYEI